MEQMKHCSTEDEAYGFVCGLNAASDGHIHSVHMDKKMVTWIDENKKAAELPVKHPPLTPQQYVALNGTVCPVCRSSDRMGHEVEYDPGDGLVTRGVSCNNPDCEASWVECYELSGYDNLEH